MIYVNGMNSANSNKKIPSVVSEKLRLRKMRKSGRTRALEAAGRRERMRKLEMEQRTKEMRARTRMAQAQPRRSKSSVSIRGKMTPPMEPPVEAIPVARPRRFLKKWPTAAMEGVKRRVEAMPLRTPNDRMNW